VSLLTLTNLRQYPPAKPLRNTWHLGALPLRHRSLPLAESKSPDNLATNRR
jgi:hypothetical protein